MTLDQPVSPVHSWGMLTTGAWSWAWIPPVFPTSQAVRLSDMDGWVEQGGRLLLIDGCVQNNPTEYKPSSAIRLAVRNAGNMTYLALHTAEALFDRDTGEPEDILHYRILKGPWPAPAWQHNKWVRTKPGLGKWEAVALIAQWSAWAVYG